MRSFLRPPRRQKGGSASAARSSVYMMMPEPSRRPAASPWKARASSCWRRRTRPRTNIQLWRGFPLCWMASRVLWKVLFGTRASCPPCGGPGNGHCVVASPACRERSIEASDWYSRRRRTGSPPSQASDWYPGRAGGVLARRQSLHSIGLRKGLAPTPKRQLGAKATANQQPRESSAQRKARKALSQQPPSKRTLHARDTHHV